MITMSGEMHSPDTEIPEREGSVMRKSFIEYVFIPDSCGPVSGPEADAARGFSSVTGRRRKESGETIRQFPKNNRVKPEQN